jgi:hypothetical protein
VRLYSRNACDWAMRLAAIAAAAERIKARSFTIDGEAVVLGPDGLSRFEELPRREAARTAVLYAFDGQVPRRGTGPRLELARQRQGLRDLDHLDGFGRIALQNCFSLLALLSWLCSVAMIVSIATTHPYGSHAFKNSVHGLAGDGEVVCSDAKAAAPAIPAAPNRKAGIIPHPASVGAVVTGTPAGAAFVGRSAVASAPFGRAASLARALAGTLNTFPGETVMTLPSSR